MPTAFPANWHEAVPYILWAALVIALGFQAVTSLFEGQYKKSIAAFVLMVALAASFLYWHQVAEIQISLGFVAAASFAVFLVLAGSEFFSLRSDFRIYMEPRRLEKKHAKILQAHLSNYDPFPVTVRFDPSSQEAAEYASQLAGAIGNTAWSVEISTSDKGPSTSGVGLLVFTEGENAKPAFSKGKDPKQNLEAALRAAKHPPNGGGGLGAGTFKLFLVVGRRPIRVNKATSIFLRIGLWFTRLGHLRHK